MNKSLLVSLVTCSVLMGHESSLEAQSFNEIFTKGSFSGQVRGVYQYNSQLNYVNYDETTNADAHGKSDTSVLGAKVSFSTAPYYGVSLTGSGYGTFRLSANQNKSDGDYLNNGRQNDNYALLGEAFIRYKQGDNSIQIGRFELDTPLLNGDDIRTIPNLFQGVYATVSPRDALILEAGFINRMAGWENGGNNSKFEKFSHTMNVDGYIPDTSSVLFAGMTYGKEESPWGLKIYDYLTTNVMNQVYSEGKVSWYGVTVQGQYLVSKATQKLKDYALSQGTQRIDSSIWGVQLGYSLTQAHCDVSVAYNKSAKKENTLNNGGTPDLFGGANDPLFTSMDVETANESGGINAYKVSITYTPYEKMSVALEGALFKKGFDEGKVQEVDLTMGYTMSESLSFETVLSRIVMTPTMGSETTNNRLRLAVKYSF